MDRSYKWIGVWDIKGAVEREKAVREARDKEPIFISDGDYLEERHSIAKGTYAPQSKVTYNIPPMIERQGTDGYVEYGVTKRNVSALVSPAYAVNASHVFIMTRIAFATISDAEIWRKSPDGEVWFTGALSSTLLSVDE